MAEARFFRSKGPFSVQDLAELTGSSLDRHADPALVLRDVSALDSAEASDLSFLDNVKYKSQFFETRAGACFVSPQMAAQVPDRNDLLVHDNPYKAYALAAQAFYPEPMPQADISSAAHIQDHVKIGEGCVVEAGVILAHGVELGERCYIESGAVIRENTVLGSNCRVGANAVISHSVIGDFVRIYPGAKIGQDGFGFAIDPAGYVKVPQLGRVVIEDHVEIGANTTIDRGAGPDTVIGQGTWIDNLVQIGHNVKIGRGCIIVAQVGISGSTVIEDYVALGGQVGVAGHLRIGQGARLAAQSGVMRDVPAGEEQMGAPSVPAKQFMRQVVALKQLINRKK